MSETLIRRGFETALKTWADGESLRVAFENVKFEPGADAIWLQAILLPGETTSRNVERTNRSFVGLFQVNVFGDFGKGPGPIGAVADSLASVYALDAPMTVGGLDIWITQPMSRSRALIDGPRYYVACSWPYAASSYPT